MRGISSAVLAIALGIACGQGSIFACSDDAMCDAESGGACEANGYCSYPDEACESGKRYGDLGAAGIAGSCVPVSDASSTSVGASGDGDSDVTSSAMTSDGATGPAVDGSSGTGPTDTCPADWWDCAWTSRRTISLDGRGLAGDLTDFVVPVALDDPEAAEGALLEVVDDAGQVLAFEIEAWPVGGTGQLWVRVPSIAAGSTTQIHAYLGAPGTGRNLGGVWDEDFAAVWHLSTLDDAGGNAITLSDFGSALAAGPFADGRDFPSGGYLLAPGSGPLADLLGGFTASAWVFVTNPTGAPRIVDKADAGASTRGWTWKVSNAALPFTVSLDIGGTTEGEWRTDTSGSSLSDWHHLVVQYPSPANEARFWLDGIERPATMVDPVVGGPSDSDLPLTIGGAAYIGASFVGTIDEVRISTSARSDDWILAEFLAGDGQLVTVGPREDLPR